MVTDERDGAAPGRTGSTALLGFACAAQAPFVWAYGELLWSRGHYRFLPLLAVVVAALAWKRWPRGRRFESSRWEPVLGVAAAAAMLTAVALDSAEAAGLGFLLTLGFGVAHFGGRAAMQSVGPVWALCWVLAPLPFDIDLRAAEWLALSCADAASHLLDDRGLRHLMSGTVLELPGARFAIDAAPLVLSLGVWAAAGALWLGRSAGHALLLALVCSAWVPLLETLRIAAVGNAYAHYGLELGSGSGQAFAIAITLAFGALLAIPMDGFVSWTIHVGGVTRTGARRLWRRVRRKFRRTDGLRDAMAGQTSAAARRAGPSTSTVGAPVLRDLPRGRVLPAVAVVALLVGGAELLRWSFEASAVGEKLAALDASSLPDVVGSWSRSEFRSEDRPATSYFGEESKVWHYRGAAPGTRLAIAVDRGQGAARDLRRHYRLIGWNYRSHEQSPLSGVLEASLSGPDAERGFLILGSIVDDEASAPTAARPKASAQASGGPFRIRAFAESDRPLEAADRAVTRQLFDEVRTALTGGPS